MLSKAPREAPESKNSVFVLLLKKKKKIPIHAAAAETSSQLFHKQAVSFDCDLLSPAVALII